MKKYLFYLLLFCMFSTFANAQSYAFMGVPVAGTIDQFSAKIKAKGFVQKSTKKGERVFIGKYEGDPGKLIVSFNPSDKNKVYEILFEFKGKKDDYNLFYRLMDNFNKAYNDKLESDGECWYADLDNGTVFIDIREDGITVLQYSDSKYLENHSELVPEPEF